MSSFIHSHLSLIVFSIAFLFPYITTLPISDNPLDKFVEFLEKSNCSMPKEIEIPFPGDSSHFNYLSIPLNECKTSDAFQENDEAKFLCHEIFEVLENITCSEFNTPLPKIKSKPLSEYACPDFPMLQAEFPDGSDYLSRKLVDGTLCKLMCTKEQKYETLCKTLLWSYDTQAKLKSASVITAEKNEAEMENKVVSDAGATIENSAQEEKKSKPEENNEVVESKTDSKNPLQLPNLGNLPASNKSNSSVTDQTISGKIEELAKNSQNATDMKTATTLTSNQKMSAAKDQSEIQTQDVAANLQTTESNQNPQTKNDAQHQDETNVDASSKNAKAEKNNSVTLNTGLLPKTSSVKNTKNITISLPDKENHIGSVSTDTNAATNGNSDNVVSQDNEIGDELKNNSENGKKDEKTKQTDSKADGEVTKLEKPKLTDFEGPDGNLPDIDTKQLESTTMPSDRDEEFDHQEEKEQDQYSNDTENEGEYPRPEYDNSSSLKNKESSVKSSDIEGPNQKMNNYDTLSSRNNNGRVPDDIQILSQFPEQEDSHFFFYFLSIVLILMAGYLIFHNKQKIIALIVEGRHERRRRSHGGGYKKLETK